MHLLCIYIILCSSYNIAIITETRYSRMESNDQHSNAPFFLQPFHHYRIPSELFKPYFKKLCPESKLIYAIALSRMCLSQKHRWNVNGRVYVHLTNAEICNFLNCSHGKATKVLRQLEQYNLLRQERRFSSPTRLFLLNFNDAEKQQTDMHISVTGNHQKTAPK